MNYNFRKVFVIFLISLITIFSSNSSKGAIPIIYTEFDTYSYKAGQVTTINLIVIDDDPKEWWCTQNNNFSGQGNLLSGKISYQLPTVAGNYSYLFFIRDYSSNIVNTSISVYVETFTGTSETSIPTTTSGNAGTNTSVDSQVTYGAYGFTITLGIPFFLVLYFKRRKINQ